MILLLSKLFKKTTPALSYMLVTRWSVLSFTVLIVSLFIWIGATLFYISSQQNWRQIEHSKVDVQNTLENLHDKIGTALTDYAFWNDAYKHTSGKVDMSWVYDNDNIGVSLYEKYHLEGVFIIDPNLNTRYSLIDGKLSDVQATRWISDDLRDLISSAKKNAAVERCAYGYAFVEGEPAIITAAVIRPEYSVSHYQQFSILLFVYKLGLDKLHILDRKFDLHTLRTERGKNTSLAQPSVNLNTLEGKPFSLIWNAENPGDKLLKTLIPMLIFSGVIFVFLIHYLQKKVFAAASVLDATQSALTMSEERFRNISESCSDWIWETDRHHKLTYLSDRFADVTGFTTHECLGRSLASFMSYSKAAFENMAFESLNSLNSCKPIKCYLIDKNNKMHHCNLFVCTINLNDEVIGYRGTVCDITEEVEAKAHIQYMSQHDVLTGLANRGYMHSFLQSKLDIKNSSRAYLAILSLDLDRFKPVNDTLGHQAGDRVLNEVARRLKQCVQHGDLVARMGGDEFIIIVSESASFSETETLCQSILEAINKIIIVGEHELSVGVSIGIALFPADGDYANDLLRYADIALYEAKSAGRNNWQFYTDEMNTRILERRQIETDLRQALRCSELYLEFQPRYEIDGIKLAGAEALVRWHHPEKGVLSPAHFIPVAEETGLIVPISDWVLHQACKEAAKWERELTVSVNLSSVEFQHDDLTARINKILKETGISPGRLELEITESVMLDDAERALVIMKELKSLGVRLSMDDFGTGYSSLSYLRSYPFDGLKIDQSFIANLDGSESSKAIIQSIVNLGRAMSLTVTAEGIETLAQLDELLRINCHQAQGYYLGQPMKVDALKKLMALW